jgi:hypothetical protein
VPEHADIHFGTDVSNRPSVKALASILFGIGHLGVACRRDGQRVRASPECIGIAVRIARAVKAILLTSPNRLSKNRAIAPSWCGGSEAAVPTGVELLDVAARPPVSDKALFGKPAVNGLAFADSACVCDQRFLPELNLSFLLL